MERTTKFTPAKSSLAVDLIAYQEGAVVSREIINNKVGSITLFAFDVGQGLSEHTSPFDALVHLLEGEADITISEVPHRVTPGQVILMPANEPHALNAVTRFKILLTMIRS